MTGIGWGFFRRLEEDRSLNGGGYYLSPYMWILTTSFREFISHISNALNLSMVFEPQDMEQGM